MLKDLDDLEKISRIDKANMLGQVEAFPQQCRQAIEKSNRPLFDFPSNIKNVAILGMGGSGISGNIIQVLLEGELSLPFIVNKGYGVPLAIGKDSLVFAVSYSGNTEETLAATNEAYRRGAHIVAISSGGRLAKLSEEYQFPLVLVPKGIPPRAALGYLFLPILLAFQNSTLVSNLDSSLQESLILLESKSSEFGRESLLAGNLAKRLALKLFGKVPVVYGAEGITGVAALRWKCQFNENSKIPAFWGQYPELDHNEIVGWELLSHLTREFFLVSLRDKGELPQATKRFEVTESLIKDHLGDAIQCWSEGESNLARFFSLAYLGDFVSVYLAILYEVDPTPVERVEVLKRRLAEAR